MNCWKLSVSLSSKSVMTFPKHLKISVNPMRYFMELQATHGQNLEISGGIEGLLIKDLAQAIGFDYEIHTPEDQEWGRRNQDGNWTGMLGMVDRGTVDMAVTTIGITEERYNSFTQIPYTVSELGFVVDKPRFVTDDSRFYRPFQTELWYALFASFLFTTSVLWLLPGRKVSILRLATKMLGMTFGKDSFKRGIPPATKIVSNCWVMSSMFLAFSYSAVLLSSLMLPIRENGIRTVDELVDAVLNHNHKVPLPKGSGSFLELLTQSPKFRDVAQKCIDNNWFYERVNGYIPQIEHNSAHLDLKLISQMNFGIEPFTSKFISDDNLFVVNIGLVSRKFFCCNRKLRWYLSRMMETGLFESYVGQTIMKSSSDRQLVTEASLVTPLSLTNLKGVFFLFMFGLFLALIVFVIELLYDNFV